MKTALFSLLTLFTVSQLYSQCDAPGVLDWQFNAEGEVEILAYFPEGTIGYEIEFVALYASMFFGADNIVFEDAAAEGVTALSFDPSSIVPIGMDSAKYFYEVLLKTQCGADEYSDEFRFYVSPLSLRNDPEQECQQEFTLIQYLADGAGFLVDHEIEVGLGEPAQQVESLSILVDIGHTFNGDISMSLTSPSGTTVPLLNYPNGMLGSRGLSMLFSDDAPPFDGPVGEFAPAEPFSAFEGELANGIWTLTVIDHLANNFGYVFGGCLNLNTSPCTASLSGKVFYDFNDNGSHDDGEPGLANALIQNNLDSSFFFANAAGDYVRCLGEGPVSLSLANAPLYFTNAPATQTLVMEEGDVITDVNFALNAEGTLVDLSADLYTSGQDRPGFSNVYYVACSNHGNTCVDDAVLEVELDELLSITSVSGGSAAFTANTASIALGTLCPTETMVIALQHTLPDTVSLGTELESLATLLPLEGDGVAADNMSSLNTTVVGSFDPNDKWVSREAIETVFLESEEYLTYHIRFQNTGTFFAEFVVIADTIDALLDFSTFELLGASHAVELSNVGRHVDFIFDNIFLPDSASDPEGSQGYVRYRIKPKQDFALGDTISNTAYIYFDFNEPIITNTVSTVWDVGLGMTEYRLAPAVYPNPTSTAVHIKSSERGSARQYAVYSMLGKRVMQGEIAGSMDSFTIAVENLIPGVYLLQLEGDVAFRAVRWVKI